MADYRFDGRTLKDRRGSRVGETDGKTIRDGRGGRVGEFDGKTIRDARGGRVAEFDGDTIRDARGSRIGTIADVRKAIDGPGGGVLVALWVLFVR